MYKAVTRGAVLALCVMFYATLAQAQQYAALVMDARTGKVIHAVNADTRVHPASLTKMMTLYIVFDAIRRGQMSLDQKITISAHAAAEPPSRLGLKPGQQIELRYLIRAAAIKSANDAATAMGEAVAGSESAFAARMNQYARAMGMQNTTFQNANGLTREGHMSSARDMAILGRHLVYDFPQYYNIFSRESTSAGIATVRNTNRRMLDAYPGADGIKTGYTKAAGFNLVSSAQRGNKRVIVALMGGKSTAGRNAEVARLMDLGFSEMPSTARLIPPTPVRLASLDSAPAKATVKTIPPGPAASLTVIAGARPLPRASEDGSITRSNATIAAAIAEVNAELVAQSDAVRDGRPLPRPAAPGAAPAPLIVGSASTFGVAPARPPVAVPETIEPVAVASSAGTTGGNDWGVQIGTYRAKGDAERQLLTTALRDVPQLDGGLRRVEAAKVQGVTVFRAQFVGLSQSDALGACESLARLRADCLPLAPGI